MHNSIMVLADMVQKDPGIIVGPISTFFGWILNFIFNIISKITTENALGFSIIVFTVFTRLCLLPLAVKQQKSMFLMQKLQPDIAKIQKKYEGKNQDPEVQRKMNMELQRLYTEKGYNPMAGCLPMLIQFPIFIALYFIMRNPYLFIEQINSIYTGLADIILSSSDYIEKAIVPFAYNLVPDSLRPFDLENAGNLMKIMSKLTPSQWAEIQTIVPNLDDMLIKKTEMETFFGLTLTETVGLNLKKIMFPIISGFTTFLSSWITTRRNKPTDPNVQAQQRIMNITMPLVMAYITTSLPAGVGIYWITSNIVLILQQIFIGKYYEKYYNSESNGK